MSAREHEAVTLGHMEPTLRQRLGGRRAISWQAVVVGDLLIVLLATLLAVVGSGERKPLDAATDVFAITTASAIVAALYTGVAHLTIFRNRARSPLPLPVTIGFHLSIGMIFVAGFFVGAVILGVPVLGGSPAFVVAVLIGGLLVCLPTALLLDASDRYRDSRHSALKRLTELERLRVSEWSLRQALKSLSTSIADDSYSADIASRLDVLDLSEDSRLSTGDWWQASLAHHQDDHSAHAVTASSPSIERQKPDVFVNHVATLLADEYPVVRWSGQLPNALSNFPRSLMLMTTLAAFTTWLFLAFFVPSSTGLPMGLAAAAWVFLVYGIAAKTDVAKRVSPTLTLVIAILLSTTGVIAWTLMDSGGESTTSSTFVSAFAIMIGVFVSVGVASWATSVDRCRESQLRELDDAIARRGAESTAVFASLTAVVTRLSEVPPLVNSVAIAACATGLQRVQREIDPVHARRIIDWTESVVSAPGILLPTHLAGRLEEVVHPWRALADITVTCPARDIETDVMDNIVAIVNEAIRNACRHGDAQVITVTVSVESPSEIRIEVIDDGVGLSATDDGVGFELFTSASAGDFQVTPRSPGPGTAVVVSLDLTGSSKVPS